MMLGSGSIRKESAGPDFTRRELLEMMPYDDKLYQLKVTGEQFKKMYAFMLRDEAFAGESTEFYQYSTGVEVEYDYNKKQFTKFNFEGKPIKESEIYTVGLQDFHYSNFKEFFGFPLEEVAANGKPVVIATSILDVIEEYLSTHATVDAMVEGRLVVIK